MSRLGALQTGFQDYLLGRDEGFRAAVRDSAKADRDSLLAVYRDGYALRLIEALGDEYPGLLAMLGGERFDALARDFIAANPSRHPSIRWFGRGMADFISTAEPWSGIDALADMARFEWTLGEAFDAEDRAPIAVEALMALPGEAWESLRFETLPSLRRIDLHWGTPQAWQQRETVAAGALEVEPEAAPVAWVFWRPEFETQFRSMEADEAAALDALRQGCSFPELCETLASFVGEDSAPARAAGLLRAWIDQGMIAGLRFDEGEEEP